MHHIKELFETNTLADQDVPEVGETELETFWERIISLPHARLSEPDRVCGLKLMVVTQQLLGLTC